MPESVADRPTKAHEYVFLLAKSGTYHYDAGAIAEQAVETASGNKQRHVSDGSRGRADHLGKGVPWTGTTRNARTVWSITTQPFAGAHFATMPRALAARCILAGCPAGGTVLDPFAGSGTTGLVADRIGRHALLVELNPDYVAMAESRIRSDAPLFPTVVA
jgi:DNA modification methylase